MNITVTITAREALDLHVWDALCALKGINEWAINEGMMDVNEEITLTLDEARQLGLTDLKEERSHGTKN
jgi:hypothetical protein